MDDIEAIRLLKARYCRFLDTRDIDAWRELFAPDVVVLLDVAVSTGGADPHALVQALASSQLAVETVATVRDKVVEAYQEILRMPI